jgi:predicted DNA-binding transcriptional regulator YafY
MSSLANTPTTWAVEVLLETTLDEAQQYVPPVIATLEQASDGVMLRCSVGQLEWIAHFLSGLSFPFIVLQPTELLQELRKLSERIAAIATRTR